MSLIPNFFLESVIAILVEQKNVEGVTIKHCIGSGFLVFKEYEPNKGHIFLITNKHVISNRSEIYLRFNSIDETDSKDYLLTLIKDEIKLYSEHENTNIDIVAINIDTNILLEENKTYASFVLGHHTTTLKEMAETGIEEGSLVYALGFPMNLLDWIKTPISRLGNISKIKHIFRNKDELNFIIDAQVFPGNSGGPVISRPEILAIEGKPHNDKTNLIGIVHSYIPYVEQAISLQTGKIRSTFEENSGLTFVHPVDFIIEVVELEITRLGFNELYEKTSKET